MAPLVPTSCQEKQRLFDEFVVAAREYVRMESAKAQDLVSDDQVALFDFEFEIARRRKDDAKSALDEHLRQHGC